MAVVQAYLFLSAYVGVVIISNVLYFNYISYLLDFCVMSYQRSFKFRRDRSQVDQQPYLNSSRFDQSHSYPTLVLHFLRCYFPSNCIIFIATKQLRQLVSLYHDAISNFIHFVVVNIDRIKQKMLTLNLTDYARQLRFISIFFLHEIDSKSTFLYFKRAINLERLVHFSIIAISCKFHLGNLSFLFYLTYN